MKLTRSDKERELTVRDVEVAVGGVAVLLTLVGLETQVLPHHIDEARQREELWQSVKSTHIYQELELAGGLATETDLGRGHRQGRCLARLLHPLQTAVVTSAATDQDPGPYQGGLDHEDPLAVPYRRLGGDSEGVGGDQFLVKTSAVLYAAITKRFPFTSAATSPQEVEDPFLF